MVNDWKVMKKMQQGVSQSKRKVVQKMDTKWSTPEASVIKLNGDASVFPGPDTFSIGMLIRNHQCSFVAGRTCRIQYIETDSLLGERAINPQLVNVLEAGDVIRECHRRMKNLAEIDQSIATVHPKCRTHPCPPNEDNPLDNMTGDPMLLGAKCRMTPKFFNEDTR
ncbi:hypothetical protein AgCh_031335 [Apium graveolens]